MRRAGLVHDLGRLGVSNGIWDKKTDSTPAERERVRLHPYLTERTLASSPALAQLGAIAVQHHERLDGSGYPRGLTGDAITPGGRVLAAADTYHAKIEPRPHRPTRCRRRGRRRIAATRCGPGGWTEKPSTPCSASAGHRGRAPPRLAQWTDSTRDRGAAGLLARGLSTKEIADRLGISRKTASNHVEHIYTKIGVSNRALASLFAVKHGLMSGGMDEATQPDRASSGPQEFPGTRDSAALTDCEPHSVYS